MKNSLTKDRGFSLIELMIAMGLGIFLIGAAASVYFAQSQTYKTTTSQASIQNVENAIAGILAPAIRSAGFAGCASITNAKTNLVGGGSPPLGILSPIAKPSPFIYGYDAKGTSSVTPPNAATIVSDNPANSSALSSWLPALDANLSGHVEAGSDVLVLLGAAPASTPVNITSYVPKSTTFDIEEIGSAGVGQIAMVSNCVGTSIFKITGIAGKTISHAVGAGTDDNSLGIIPLNFQPGSQFIPLQQTAFYVAQGTGDQATLMQAVYSNGVWTDQPLIPGVESMQVLYGIGSSGVVTQYLSADGVGSNWANVYAIRIGFLIQGQKGTGSSGTASQRTYNVLGTNVTVPADGRLRHVYELTIEMRNAT